MFWSSLRAIIEDDIADKSVASLRRKRAVLLVFSVPAVVVSIADEEFTDALWVVTTTLMLMLVTGRIFKFFDPMPERPSLSDSLWIKSIV